jgi:hypothetical protein
MHRKNSPKYNCQNRKNTWELGQILFYERSGEKINIIEVQYLITIQQISTKQTSTYHQTIKQ